MPKYLSFTGYGLLAVLFYLFSAINVFSAPVPADGNRESYINTIIQRAADMELHNDPYWRLLLHYKKNLLGGYKSLIDDKAFFISPDGKTDPKKELDATIRAFFTPVSEYAQEKRHPLLRFIARYNYLNSKLNIDQSALPLDASKQFDEYYRTLKIRNATLVFSSGYLGSPASMFGHTFLILERSDSNRLLSLSVNYAARSDDSFGPIFAFKGLFGLYEGLYSFMPYYDKINEYVYSEMRDMWEYKLNFSEDEIRRMVMHIIELEGIESDYFFMTENCSYNLVFLLEAARPECPITDDFFLTEPMQTVREAINYGMVDSTTYRPSLYSKIMYRAGVIDETCEEKAIALAKGEAFEDSFKSNEEKAETLDLASEYLQFLLVKRLITQEDYAKRLIAVLQKRSELDYKSDTLANITIPSLPESAHKSSKLSVGEGIYAGKNFLELKYRLNCHELMDEDEAFAPNTEYSFMNAAFRYYYETKKIRLKHLDFFSVTSLPVMNKYFIDTSWKAKFGFEQIVTPDLTNALAANFRGGSGGAFSLGWAGDVYAMAELNANISNKFDYYNFTTVGVCAGLITSYKYTFKSHIFASWGYAPLGNTTSDWTAGVEGMLSPIKDFAVSAKYSKHFVFGKTFDEIRVNASIYF